MKVLESPNKSLIGLEGVVIDETKNMIYINKKSIPKKKTKFVFTCKGESFIKEGQELCRPEER